MNHTRTLRLPIALAAIATVATAARAADPKNTIRTPITFSPAARAVFELTLRTGYLCTFSELRKLDTPAEGGPLKTCEAILAGLGFSPKIQQIAEDALRPPGRPAIVLDPDARPVLAGRGAVTLLSTYPLRPRKAGRSMTWPRQAVVIGAVPPSRTGTKALRITPRVVDMGIRDDGDVVTRKFTVENTLAEPVTIRRARTTCPCATLIGATGRIAPGGRLSFEARFDAKNRWGYQEAQILLQTDRGAALAKLSGFVRNVTGYFPAKLDFGAVSVTDAPVTRTITVLDQAFGAREFVASAAWRDPLSCRQEEGYDANWEAPVDRIHVTLDPRKARVGPLGGAVEVTFVQRNKRRAVAIPIRALILKDRREYRMLVVRDAAGGEPLNRRLILPGLSIQDLPSLSVAPKPSPLRISAEKTEAGLLAVRVRSKALPPGVVEARAEFTLKDNGRPTHYALYVVVNVGRKAK